MSWLTLLLLAGVPVVYWLLKLRDKARAARGEPARSAFRLVIGAFALLTMLFTGGCGLFLLAGELLRSPSGAADDFMSAGLVLIVSGVPFLSALVVWWLSMRQPHK